jgi:hypothetical protein
MVRISSARVGGLRFLKVGRLCFSFCVTRDRRPLKGADIGRRNRFDSSTLVGLALVAMIIAIGCTNTVGGFALRATVAVPLVWTHVVSMDAATRFVLPAVAVQS